MPFKRKYNLEEERKIKKYLRINNVYEYRDKVLETIRISNDMSYTHLRLGYVYYILKYGEDKNILKRFGFVGT